MIRENLLIVLIGGLLAVGCKTRKESGSGLESGSGPVVKLQTAGAPVNADSVMLTFVVYNHSDTVQHFCKWDTPFEPLLGKYLSVTDKAGTEADYKGAMARRVMPPPSESYILVNPHDSVSATFNLAKGYAVKPGSYTVRYIASGLSGLQAGNELKVVVPGGVSSK
ncbi:protease [Pararcticibacter amylolyticus]|uniref:Protease n=1 Tax=Pararcticibacter amylolyticus TaxID=2173175 RepID=A0A2U2PD49_9SPHI|nr:protease [Pararcticibacter amylolyticus]PWG79315.1 protease [Pararcticibacter amylolyticus]